MYSFFFPPEARSYIEPRQWQALMAIRAHMDDLAPADALASIHPGYVLGASFLAVPVLFLKLPLILAACCWVILTMCGDEIPRELFGRRFGQPVWATTDFHLSAEVRSAVAAIRSQLRPVQRAQVADVRTGVELWHLLQLARVWQEGGARPCWRV